MTISMTFEYHPSQKIRECRQLVDKFPAVEENGAIKPIRSHKNVVYKQDQGQHRKESALHTVINKMGFFFTIML